MGLFPRPRGGHAARGAGRCGGECLRAPMRFTLMGFAVLTPPLRVPCPPLGASGALPPRFARLRGRGLPRFCRLHHVGPLRPGIMNILRNTLSSGVFHMNLPSQPPQIQRYLASHPAKGYLVNHHSIRIPSPPGEVSAEPTEGVSDPRGRRRVISGGTIRARYSK